MSREKRILLVYHYKALNSDVGFVHSNLFVPGDVALDTIQQLWHNLEKWSAIEINAFIDGNKKGEKNGEEEDELQAGEQEAYLKELVSRNRSIKMRNLTTEFQHRFFEENCEHLPSLSTVSTLVHKSGLTRKKVTWFNRRQDPHEQLRYLDDMISIPAQCIVDIDGTVQNSEDFLSRYGWAMCGERCVRYEIVLNNITYAVMAAYTSKGFIYWEIYDTTVKGKDVAQFLRNLSMRPSIDTSSYLILDNAANQKSGEVLAVLNHSFRQRYTYCAPYSPELKPIERGFSNVKNYIRERDNSDESRDDPVGLINSAFFYYSAEGEGGSMALNHFRLYFANNKHYEELIK
jgi:transposase